MGQPAVRKGVDKTKGHGKCKPVVAVQASDNVFINGIPAVRQGDAFKPHCKHKGKAVGDRGGEGPKVFYWKEYYWMLVDNWAGMSLYRSKDLTSWENQPERILEKPGTGAEDGANGADEPCENGRRADRLHPTARDGQRSVASNSHRSLVAHRSLDRAVAAVRAVEHFERSGVDQLRSGGDRQDP